MCQSMMIFHISMPPFLAREEYHLTEIQLRIMLDTVHTPALHEFTCDKVWL